MAELKEKIDCDSMRFVRVRREDPLKQIVFISYQNLQ